MKIYGRNDLKQSICAAQLLYRFLDVVFGTSQLDFAVVKDCITGLGISVERQAYATGIHKNSAVDLAHHWQMRMAAKDEVGVDVRDLRS